MARENTTRRAFLLTTGAAAAAAAALPASARTAPAAADWREALAQLPALRAAYLAEVGRFAETLRPRFESGELHSYRENDDMAESRAGQRYESPDREIGELFGNYFGIGVYGAEGDSEIARVILALSPHADASGVGSDVDPRDHAREAAAWDVIVHARHAGWYEPTEDESLDPTA